MAKPLAVVLVHGIGAATQEYGDDFRQRLLRALPRNVHPQLRFKSIFWADIVRARQQQYLLQAEAQTGLSVTNWRRFVVEGLGDASAYTKTRNREHSAYYEIQDRLSQGLADLDDPADPEQVLILVGHSLGCHIISTYVWDVNRLKQISPAELAGWDDEVAMERAKELRTASPFRRLDTLAGYITLGSNMPLFTFTFGPERVVPITRYTTNKYQPAFPGIALQPEQRSAARWLNFYSEADLLGFPMKPLSAAHKDESLLSDHIVISEGVLRRIFLPRAWNAMAAHVGYWSNRSVISAAANLIRTMANAARTQPASPAGL